jgi:hypothetical protein
MTPAPPLTNAREAYFCELDWRRAQVEILEIWRENALEVLAEDEALILAQKQRIDELENALRKNCNSAWDIYYGTNGLLNDPYDEPDGEPKKLKKKARP